MYANSKCYLSKFLNPVHFHTSHIKFLNHKIALLESVISTSLVEMWRPYWIDANLAYFPKRHFYYVDLETFPKYIVKKDYVAIWSVRKQDIPQMKLLESRTLSQNSGYIVNLDENIWESEIALIYWTIMYFPCWNKSTKVSIVMPIFREQPFISLYVHTNSISYMCLQSGNTASQIILKQKI